jgi:hypothetical protein
MTTTALPNINWNTAHSEVYLIQHFVIKFVRELLQVFGFLQVLGFPSPIKTAMI